MYSIPEVDLHGMTLEEALAEIERELNHTFIQEEVDRRIRFVTGWGSVIRPMLTKYLRDHPLVCGISLDGPSIKVELEDLN